MIRRIELNDGEPATTAAGLVHDALTTDPVVRVSRAPAAELRARWEPIVQRLGEPARRGEDGASGWQDRSIWTDVRYDPRHAESFRHSSTAQPLHTDGAYERDAGNVVFFACCAAAASGGETIFLGADRIAETARAEAPALFDDLVRREIRFGKNNAASRRCAILTEGDRGWSINWNYYRVVSDGDPGIEALRARFADFLERRFVAPGDVEAVRLRPGECLLFHDSRVLHGRRAFEATEPGERLIWKCNIHWPRRAEA